jgi:hypothetical protein
MRGCDLYKSGLQFEEIMDMNNIKRPANFFKREEIK